MNMPTTSTTIENHRQTSTTLNSDNKGKLKVQETHLDQVEDDQICGICLYSSSNGAISRGYINCCNHYFCFVCIMEWSKVESTCPICKRRFSSIRRPPKIGVFDVERHVSVPVRDQVYYHFGNASVGPPNLYSDTKCSVCRSGADDSLLLLCDLCDVASHSYCVGLGATVPEGDWYCPDCAVLKAEYTMHETEDGAVDHCCDNKLKFASAQEHVSTFDNSQNSVCQISSSSTLPNRTLNGEDIGGANNRNEVSTRRQSIVLSQAPMVNARTLVRCRNVHERIRVLRSNWNNIRNGSLSFTSTTVNKSATIQKPVIGSSSAETNSSASLKQPSIADGGASNMSHSSSHEINRAWKMMDFAMTIERHYKRSMPQPSNSSLKKINSSKDVVAGSLSVTHRSSNKDLGCLMPRTPQKYSLVDKNRCGTHILGERSKSREQMVSAVPGVMSSKEAPFSPGQNGSKGETIISLNRHLSRSPLTTKSDAGVSCSSSTISPSLVANVSHANPQSDVSPSSDKIVHLSHRGSVDKKSAKDKIVNGENDAKSEIQSLVKLNLKILTKNQKLEDDVFKQVARTATHSILAACDLEHPKPRCQQFPSSICCHASDIQKQRRSSLMPNSCRECFYAFVKDVVSNILDKNRIFRNIA
ncbi:hypothetical protein LIER_19000 [Lithospermum erythrorhizon]|uniref:Uncharacterized protein n=1 Tax=Lithospermum erythrorhizon TaxID=34254 RepID=A0AAV3QHA4_LITER